MDIIFVRLKLLILLRLFLLGSIRLVRVKVDGFESLQNRRRSKELLVMGLWKVRILLLVVFLGGIGKSGSDVNGSYDKLEEEEEDGWSEPAVETSPECW